MMLRLAFSTLSRGGAGGRLSILIFHRVAPTTDPLFPEEVDVARFDAICGWVRKWFHVLPLREAVQRLAAQDLPPRAMALTFDDGYADNLLVAAPVLQRHGLPCTFFVATSFLDGSCMWNDVLAEAARTTQLPRADLSRSGGPGQPLHFNDMAQRRRAADALIGHAKYLGHAERVAFAHDIANQLEVSPVRGLMMTPDQVCALGRAGFDIGAHTVTHPILAKLPALEARNEMETSRVTLQRITGQDIPLFAYPNGKPGMDYSAESVRLVRDCGFEAAVSTSWGVADSGTDRFQLPRFTPWDRQPMRFGLRMLGNLRRSPTVVAADQAAA